MTVPISRAGLSSQGAAEALPPILRGLAQAPSRRRSAASVSLATKLASVPAAEQETYVLELVRSEAAAALGHDSVDEIEPDGLFKELGFDSLAAVELRNRLAAASGLRLPATLVFDYPTSSTLAEYILAEASAGAGVTQRTPLDEPFGGTAEGLGGDSGATFRSMLSQAHGQDKAAEFFQLLMAAAPFRPSFDEPPEPERGPVPVRLAEGSGGPRLICLATIAHMSGTHEYTAFAEGFQGARCVDAIPQLGFAPRELVPASFAVAVETQAEAVRRLADGQPFVLVGYSTAGLYANAVARRLEEMEASPSAVVAIDSYRMDVENQAGLVKPMLEALLGNPDEDEAISTTRLTAMAAHVRLLAEWSLLGTSAPQLLVRATEPVAGMPEQDWRCTWGIENEIDVPGSHFTVMQEQAGSAAAAVDSWLTGILGAKSEDGGRSQSSPGAIRA